jgi:hypothetical protein
MERKIIRQGLILGLAVLILFVGSSAGKEPKPIGFGRTFGGQIFERAHYIGQTKDGYLAVVAVLSEPDPDKALRYFWALKLDDKGEMTGSKIFKPVNYYRYLEMFPAEDGKYILAGKLAYYLTYRKRDEFFINKIDENNQKDWEEEHTQINSDFPFDIKRTGDGGFIIVGKTSYVGKGMADYCVMLLNKVGKLVWDKAFGTTYEDDAVSVDLAKDGGFIVAGNTSHPNALVVKIDKKGAKEWDREFQEEAIAVLTAEDGGYVLLGAAAPGLGSSQSQEVVLTKILEKGSPDWEKRLPQFTVEDFPPAIIRTRDGGYILAGQTNVQGSGDKDLFVLKLDRKGNRVWDRTFGGPKAEGANAISQTKDGGYIVAGFTDSFVNKERDVYDRDLWILKLDEKGDCAVQGCHQRGQ